MHELDFDRGMLSLLCSRDYSFRDSSVGIGIYAFMGLAIFEWNADTIRTAMSDDKPKKRLRTKD
ncbi:hypothetical protein LC653_08660 [Nostoc sp. CHAB 5784]|uniref:hypothetical protein n=1 Tax=Nostoc mirabile TaxID=2907820 RepID=UPI001E5A3A0C|nr:hypothetical protein [Nostoc mirabile]MCC5663989.1 hypothetical protein [Nostoc mirabile CHAB5784]